ncbi:MAG TPA: SRPBCC family protein [Dehalococcoidia bacterium]|nr:SRPBCC family protein [Dehalococcoidia bacterium]
MPEASALAVRKSITVRAAPEKAFEVFTAGIERWWPRKTHSVSGERTAGVTMETREGGRVFETNDAGGEIEWGVVTSWEPPRQVAFTWHPGYDNPGNYTDIEVTFTADGEGTRMELVHTGWERLGDEAARSQRSYDGGWDYVLAQFVERANE